MTCIGAYIIWHSILFFQITIDISPPVAGTVHEGAQGEPEIDFQQEKTVKVHWNDFFDRESGIWMYRYGYGAECLKPEDFDIETGKEVCILKQ